VETITKTKPPYYGTNGFPLQAGTVYGPIHSRRYGYSLGINPLPVSYKFCDFDCVYCQYGWTPKGDEKPDVGLDSEKKVELLKSANILLDEIEQAFRKIYSEKTPVHVITIAGNGEPTLHPEFPKLIDGLIELRDKYISSAPIGILSDSSQCHRIPIKQALQKLNELCMKLDAGGIETIRQINRPRGDFNLKRTLDALKALHDITLQAMFVSGMGDNSSEEQVEVWIQSVQYVAPSQVQVYTLDRPPADGKVLPVPEEKLREIAKKCYQETGIPTEVFY
jgi:wyosine [tRNA(Phe)-imidazoG37] synthetase (radical SAM superfamily)